MPSLQPTIQPPIRTFAGEHEFLSNFYPSPVEFENQLYPTVEHAFQAAKTLDPDMRTVIGNVPKAGQAKRLGRMVDLRPGWDDMRIDVMRRLLERKFAPGTDLARQLLETGEAELIEGNHWGDHFWGVCNGYGHNNLGKLLMEVRAKLQGAY